MSFSVSGTTIMMTRGDTAKFQITIKYLEDGTEYIPLHDDTIRFTMKKYLSDKSPLIVKEVPTTTCVLQIDPEDTSSLKFGEYHYNIELIHSDGETDTFITDSIMQITPEV